MDALHQQKIHFLFLRITYLFKNILLKAKQIFQSQIGRHMASSTMYGQSMLTSVVSLEIFCSHFKRNKLQVIVLNTNFIQKIFEALKYINCVCKFDNNNFLKLYLHVSMLLDINKIFFSHFGVFNCFVKHEEIFSIRVINFYKQSTLAWQCTTQAYTVLYMWLDKMSYVFREKNLQKKSQQQMQLCFQKRTQEYLVCTSIYTERDSKPILLYFS